jgi:hypothetical protein
MQKPEVMRKANVENTPKKKMSEAEAAKHISKMRERDAEMVSGIFKNLENPGVNGAKGSVSFGFKAYPGDDFVFYELWDNERYTIPRGVARHLNNNCYYKEYAHLPGESGIAGVRGAQSDGRLQSVHMQAARKIHRYEFRSLEYMDDDLEMRPVDLVEVTVSP